MNRHELVNHPSSAKNEKAKMKAAYEKYEKVMNKAGTIHRGPVPLGYETKSTHHYSSNSSSHPS